MASRIHTAKRDARRIASLDSLLGFHTEDSQPPSAVVEDLHEIFSPGGELQAFEDRRLWSPTLEYRLDGREYPKAVPERSPARFKVGQATQVFGTSRSSLLSPIVAFQRPSRMAICIRRQRRRQVLAARGRLGRNRPGRRSAWSGVSCGSR